MVFAQSYAQNFEQRFDTAWRLVDERYWDLTQTPVDWAEVRLRYEPEALSVDTEEAFYDLLERMYAELDDQHSVFVPPSKVLEIRERYGDLPCLGVFGQVAGQRGNLSYELLEQGAGYIKLPDLASDFIVENMRTIIEDFERQQITAIILDLRGNPGGRLVTMMQVAGIFTSGFLWRTITTWTLPLPYPAIGTTLTDLPLLILVDAQVNSAAEGLAGALQQQERAVVIGETSAGNVEAVLPFCLRDGSQAWIAAGVLAPIGAATWEGVGVIPDIMSSSEEALESALAYLAAQGWMW